MKFKVLFIVLIVAFLFSSCEDIITATPVSSEETSSVMTEEEIIKADYEKNPEKYVFLQNYTPQKTLYLTVEEMAAYQTQYPECNSTWYRDKLSGEDLIIYNTFLYAMENQFVYFSLYVCDGEKDYSYIREYLSLDSPFMAQNIDYDNEYFYPTHLENGKERLGVRMANFSLSDWQNNMQAVRKCKEIVAGIPEEYTTQEQKMRYLFKYVRDHIEYVEYETYYNVNFLYDAVMRGETLCDGYSNMLLLLFNLIDVECCETMGDNILDYTTATTEELENANGHTWVVAKLDDVFYNFDPTFEDGVDYSYVDQLLYFGYSDERVSIKYFECNDLRPKCTDTSRDYRFADITVDSITDFDDIIKITRFLDDETSNGDYKTVVLVNGDVTEEDYNVFIKEYSRYATSVSYLTTVYYRFEEKTVVIFETTSWLDSPY